MAKSVQNATRILRAKSSGEISSGNKAEANPSGFKKQFSDSEKQKIEDQRRQLRERLFADH